MNFEIIDDDIVLNKSNIIDTTNKISDTIFLAGINILNVIKNLLHISDFKDATSITIRDQKNMPLHIVSIESSSTAIDIDSFLTLNKWTSISASKLDSLDNVDDLDVIISDNIATYLHNEISTSLDYLKEKYSLNTLKRIYFSPDLGIQGMSFSANRGMSIIFSYTKLVQYNEFIDNDELIYDKNIFNRFEQNIKKYSLKNYFALESYENVPYYISYTPEKNGKFTYITKAITTYVTTSNKFKLLKENTIDYLKKHTIIPFNYNIENIFIPTDKETLYVVIYNTDKQHGVMILPAIK